MWPGNIYCLFLSNQIDILNNFKGFHLPIAPESKIRCFPFHLLVFSRSQRKVELNLHPSIFKANSHCFTRRTIQQYYCGTWEAVYCQQFCGAIHFTKWKPGSALKNLTCVNAFAQGVCAAIIKASICKQLCSVCPMSAFRLTQLQMEDFFILPGVSTYLVVSMVALLTFSKEKTHGTHTLQIHLLNSLDTTLCATVLVKITLPETSRRGDLSNKACLVAQEVGFSIHLPFVQMFYLYTKYN